MSLTAWNPAGRSATVGALHANYAPTSRRPIASVFRRTATFATAFCAKRDIHPDTISYCSIAFAAIAAFCFLESQKHISLLLIAPGFCYLRLWCNMLDGMVALATHKASWRGEIVNDLPDRLSDILIFAGVAYSGWTHPALAYWAMIAALLTAYVGVLGQAVGAQRQFGGVMSKPWRMVTLHIGAWITWFCGTATLASLTALDWTCVAVVLGCVQSIVVRLRRTLRGAE